ncbi:MAG: glycosyltransferase family 39 protein [Anaerolineae bacterium]|nr:glycosyltransferase family 39 protein [Anaerolineae bacterium]
MGESPPDRLTERRIVALLIVLGLLIRLPLVFAPLTYSNSDDWRQADTASIARNFYENGFNLLYPQINWGGSGPGYVETEFQLYPFLTALLYLVFGEQVWLGRLVSLLFMGLTSAMFYRLARRTTSPQVALWALFFFVIAPLGVRYGVAYMPEATVFFFYIAALYLFRRWLDDDETRFLWLAGASTALAILVKPTAIHIGLIFLLQLIERHRLRFLSNWRLWAFGAVSLLPGVLWYLHARNLYLTYGNTFGLLSGGDSKLGSLDYWLSPRFYFNLLELDARWIFGWAGVLALLIGLAVCMRPDCHLTLPIFGAITVFIYYMIVARYAQASWGIQYHIYAVPYAALGAGPGLEWLFKGWRDKTLRQPPRVLAGVALLVLILAGGAYVYRGLLVPSGEHLMACGEQVAEVVPEDALIVASTTSTAIQDGVSNNYQEPQIFFYSNRRGWSLPAEQHQPERLEQYRAAGARYFVIYSEELYENNPALAGYLDANGEQIGPGIDAGCAIYRLK